MIRTLTSILAILLLVGCDQCYKVECANGGTCRYGDCVCSDGIERTFCKLDTCLAPGRCVHGHCEFGFCACDENWDGKLCDIATYIDHSGDYFGAYVCNEYQQTTTFRLELKEKEGYTYTILETDSNLKYEVLFTDLENFYIEEQTIFQNEYWRKDVSGVGTQKDGIIYIELAYKLFDEYGYYYDDVYCTFEGDLKQF
ncbi:MAG: hypothetical protein R2813_07615 [Flavobacteriales bacterium]